MGSPSHTHWRRNQRPEPARTKGRIPHFCRGNSALVHFPVALTPAPLAVIAHLQQSVLGVVPLGAARTFQVAPPRRSLVVIVFSHGEGQTATARDEEHLQRWLAGFWHRACIPSIPSLIGSAALGRLALGSCSIWSGRRERTDRYVISVRIAKRELAGLRVRIHVWLLFEPSDESTRSLEREVEIIDTEE